MGNPAKILVVDDEEDIRDLLDITFTREGYRVYQASSGEEALEKARLNMPELIILDVMLPGIDGHETCLRIKKDPELKRIPVLMLSAKSEEMDQIIGLKIGADGYMPKPFTPQLLVAKVNAILRMLVKEVEDEQASVSYLDLRMNPNNHSVTLENDALKLTNVEYQILYMFLSRPGRVYSREKILERVRGDDVIITERTVDVHILSLRRKLKDYAQYIETVRGVGYRFSA